MSALRDENGELTDDAKPGTTYEFDAWDRFATAALSARLKRDGWVNAWSIASEAANIADAMLAERRKRYSPL